ncbi:MAG: hypothetical protein WD009_06885 [Phycisphaeraceae bacterium]
MCVFAIVALLAWPSPRAAAMLDAELLGPDLDPEPVHVRGLYDGALHYVDSDRRLQRRPVDRFVSLRRIAGRSADDGEHALDTAGGVELVDGQRIAGRWIGGGDDGQSLIWEHPQLGRIDLPLDRVARLWHADAGRPDPGRPPVQDIVRLSNGDELRGFIVGVGDDGVELQMDDADDPVHLPGARIHRLVLANPGAAPDVGWHELHLADGSRLLARELELDDEEAIEARIALRGDNAASTRLPLEALARVDFTAAGRRLVPLIDLPRELVAGGEAFALPVGPYVRGGALHLRAPVTLRFELPAGAVRLAADAELATGGDAPRHLTDWADFELLLRSDGEEARWRFSGEQSSVRINAELAGEVLEIELDPGVNGPILDRLRLRQAEVLIVDEHVSR